MTRIATSTMQGEAIAGMLQRQTELARTQNELTTGKRLRSPADDPAAAVQVLNLQRSLDANRQYESNATTVGNRLRYEEQALADITSSLQRIQELTLQANNSVLDEPSRGMIATEMRARVEELLDIANRRDASGEYLFAGFNSATQPFARTASGVQYYGDASARYVNLSPTQRVADGHSGRETFQDIIAGNGTFTTAANPANTGAAVIDAGSLLSRPAWVADTYTVRFTSATAWEVLDGSNAQIATGASSATGVATIEFNGVRVTVSGEAVAGDRFTIAPAGRQDLFGALDALIATVTASTSTAPERAQFATRMAGSIAQVSQSIDHMLGVRAEVGSRLNAIDAADSARADLDLELQRTLSELSDVDYAEAISRLNLQLVGLQAAQQAYTRIGRLSLFDYL
jgi:flagellar hook-associated protein 3 FlgL